MRLLVVLSIVLAIVSVLAAVPALAIKICIDPGHGGADPGGVGCGLEEDDIVLDVSQRLKTALEANGFDVVITRTTDAAVSLTGRTDFANAQGADRFASIHANAFSDPSANGTETFCHTSANSSSPSFDLRNRVQTELVDAWGLTDRGGKQDDFHVLRETNMPAILSELGFVTNCSVDALVLADLGRRQEAADAHLAGIAAHMGVTIDDDPPQTGTANGVVFQDQGVGTDNMDIRLPGATVLVVDTGATVAAGADGGAWTFSLPPGEHTVRASLAGYQDTELSCTVIAGDVAWCSIGLFAEAAGEGEGEGVPVGEGEGEPASEGEGEPVGPIGTNNDVARVTILPPVESQGGCGQTGTAGVVVFGALLALLTRRRAFAALALVMAIAAPANAAEQTAQHSAEQTTKDTAQARAIDARVVARGLYTSAALSPSAQMLLVSDDHYAGLSVIDVKSGHVRMLSEAARAGFRSLWVDDAHVAHRNPKRPFDGDPLITLNLDGVFTGPFFEHATVRAKQRAAKGDVDIVEVNGKIISRADDRCFGPVVSALGDVMFQCLRTGMYLHRAKSGDNLALGDGTAPSFSVDGGLMVFLRTSDEGHVTLESDLVVVDLRKPKAVVLPLAKTPALERAPSLSRDGTMISWVVDDTVVLARLQLPR